jgi:hypothetical protein
MISDENLSALKKSLPKGYFKQTCAKTTLSERTVANFFAGKIYNIHVHEAALAVLEEWNTRTSAIVTQQQSLTQ